MTGPGYLKLALVTESSFGILYRELKFNQEQLKNVSDLVVFSLAYLFLLEPQWKDICSHYFHSLQKGVTQCMCHY